jgi:hypothetical protein
MIEEQQQDVMVDGVKVYVALQGGRLHAMVRAVDQATFDQQALAVGLKVYTNSAQPAVIDPETEEVITPAVEASGPLIAAKGVTITEMGAHVLQQGTYDEEGNELTAPVLDNRYHVNFWLSPDVVERGQWQQWATAWTQNGMPAAANNQEAAIEFQGIELIDPMTVTSPSNVLL